MPETSPSGRPGIHEDRIRASALERIVALGGESEQTGDNFTVRHQIVEYAGFNRALAELQRIHRRGLVAHVAESLQIVGQTGSGKTTLMSWYVQNFPRYEVDGTLIIPVLYVETPEAPSLKSLAEAFLTALGDPWAQKGTAAEKTERILHLCRLCGVQLIIFDEIQHFIDGERRSELMRLTDWLKRLINKLARPVVLCGLPRSMLVTRANPQLRRRFAAPYYLEPFAFKTKEQQLEFRGVLKVLAKGMPEGSIDLSAHSEACRVYFATSGLIDYVVKLIDDSVSRGGSGPSGAITRDDLAASFARTIWMGVPERLNPFSANAKLRLLNRTGEPFEIWDDIGRYLGRSATDTRIST